MSLDDIDHDSGEFDHMQIETTVIPRRKTKRVFIKTDLSAVSARVEGAIHPRFSKEINPRCSLGVEEECQARIEKVVGIAVDEAGRRLLRMGRFKVNCPAQSGAKDIIKSRKSKCGIQPLDKIINVKCVYRRAEQTKDN